MFYFFIAPKTTHLGSINLITVHVVDGSKMTLGNENIFKETNLQIDTVTAG